MENASITGLSVFLIAPPVYPTGITLTQFPDDSDPLDSDNVEIAGSGVGLNGDLIVWDKPNAVTMRLSVIPGSEDHEKLNRIWEVNRTAKNKLSVQSRIQAVVRYPDGTSVSLMEGAMVSGPALTGGNSEGKLKTPTYGFVFEGRV